VDLYFLYRLELEGPVYYPAVVTQASLFPLVVRPWDSVKTLDDQTYLATHIVYVLSDYNKSRLSAASVADQVRFLEQAGQIYHARGDVETLGEVCDSLKITGRGYDCALMREFLTKLLTTQNPDGTWGPRSHGSSYSRYHTTWTVFNGLLEYRFDKHGVVDPVLRSAWEAGAPRSGPR
jgi:hypothetical protein